jgi:hypothetical protein
MGGTEWKRLWLVLSAPGAGEGSAKDGTVEKKRKSLFSFGSSHEVKPASEAGVASTAVAPPSNMTSIASAVFFQSPPGKPKLQKGAIPSAPVLTMTYVSQA